MKSYIVATIQMISCDKIEPNLAAAEKLICQAALHGARLVVLPECFALFGVKDQSVTGIAEATGQGGVRQKLSFMAKKYGVYLVGGTIPVSDSDDDNRPFSVCFLYDDSGNNIARYNKIHLFDVDVSDAIGAYRESETYQPGKDIVCVDTPLGRIGLAVCYDLRFPEMFRILFQQHVDIIVIPAAFTKMTGVHWMPLLKARAIENQCYVLGANQGGKHSDSRETFGHSCVMSPWGETLALTKQGEGVAFAEVNLDELTEIRKNMPVFAHQRFFVDNSN